MNTPTRQNVMFNEKRNRLRVAIIAYAYEIKGRKLIPQEDYDDLSDRIEPSIATGDKEVDEFFRNHYLPYETNWIYWYPKLEEIEALYLSLYKTV